MRRVALIALMFGCIALNGIAGAAPTPTPTPSGSGSRARHDMSKSIIQNIKAREGGVTPTLTPATARTPTADPSGNKSYTPSPKAAGK